MASKKKQGVKRVVLTNDGYSSLVYTKSGLLSLKKEIEAVAEACRLTDLDSMNSRLLYLSRSIDAMVFRLEDIPEIDTYKV